MKIYVLLFVLLICFCGSVWSQDFSISAKQLGSLAQKTQAIEMVSQYSGSQLIAEVSEQPGQSYFLMAPMNVQRAAYLLSPGEPVAAGEPYMQLFGPEVHHYHSQYLIAKRLFEQTRLLFNNNKKLFESKAISEANWLAISQQYYQASLEYDEYVHFFENVVATNEKNDSITLAAPIGGTIVYQVSNAIEMGNILARFVPTNALRLKMRIPKSSEQYAISVRTPKCELAIETINKQTEGLYQIAWTVPISDQCQLSIGEQISLVPQYSVQAYKVSRTSVFHLSGDYFIFVKNGEKYQATRVNLISSTDKDYIVSANADLQNLDVLVSSVSAAQGILIGLGE